MDGTQYQRFFTLPTQTYQRRYEAIRAVVMGGKSQKEVAQDFGFEYHTLRQFVYEFRRDIDAGCQESNPFFLETEILNTTTKRTTKMLNPL